MLWPAEDFVNYVQEQVTQLRQTTKQSEKDACLAWLLSTHFGLDGTQAANAIEIGRSLNPNAHAIWTTAEGRLQILRSDVLVPLAEVASFKKDSARLLFDALEGLQQNQGTKANAVYEAAREAKKGVELVCLVFGNASPELNREIAELNKRLRKATRLTGHHVSLVQLSDLNLKFCEALSERKVETIELDIGEVSSQKGMHRLTDGRPAYAIDLAVTKIAQLIIDHEYSIIGRNLRYPLVSRYNDGIYSTLGSADRKNFWFYNNGLTIVCDAIKEVPSDHGLKLRLGRPQIVNGCQTAFTIARFVQENPKLQSELGRVAVLVRVIEARDDGSSDVNGGRIARFTNSQNAITERDLRANDDVQTLLQRSFAKLGWFFERKEGEWRAVKGTKANASAGGYPHGRVVNKDLAQKALAFWLQKPAEAKGRARAIFEEGRSGFYQYIFTPDRPAMATPYDFLLPYFVDILFWGWRDRWTKAHTGRDATTVRQKEIVKNGDLTMLALMGERFINAWELEYLAGADISKEAVSRLRAAVQLTERASEQMDGRKRNQFAKWAFGQFETILDRLTEFCDIQIANNQELTARKLLVRSSTYESEDFRRVVRDRKWAAVPSLSSTDVESGDMVGT